MAEITDTFERQLFESFLRLGLSESAAAIAARGHNPAPPASRFDALVEHFRGPSVTEAEAKRAAIGRHGSEVEARAFWDGPSSGSSLTEGRIGRLVLQPWWPATWR